MISRSVTDPPPLLTSPLGEHMLFRRYITNRELQHFTSLPEDERSLKGDLTKLDEDARLMWFIMTWVPMDRDWRILNVAFPTRHEALGVIKGWNEESSQRREP